MNSKNEKAVIEFINKLMDEDIGKKKQDEFIHFLKNESFDPSKIIRIGGGSSN